MCDGAWGRSVLDPGGEACDGAWRARDGSCDGAWRLRWPEVPSQDGEAAGRLLEGLQWPGVGDWGWLNRLQWLRNGQGDVRA